MKKEYVKLGTIFFIVFLCVFIFVFGLNPKYGLSAEQLKNHDNLTAEETIKLYAYYQNRSDFNKIDSLLSKEALDEAGISEKDGNHRENDILNPVFLTNIEKVATEHNQDGFYERRIYVTYWSDNLFVKLGYKPSDKDATYSTDMELVKKSKDSDWVIESIGF